MGKSSEDVADEIYGLAKKVQERVHKIAKRRGADAEDVFQTMLIEANNNGDKVLRLDKPEGWLIRCANYKAQSESRNLRRQIPNWEQELDPAHLPRREILDDDRARSSEISVVVATAVKKLRPRYQEIVNACICGNESCREFAERNRLNYDTCKTRLSRAKMQLKSDEELIRLVNVHGSSSAFAVT